MKSQFNTISGVLNESTTKFADLKAISWKQNGSWNSMTYEQLKYSADKLSCQLIKLGVKKGDKVVMVSTGRPEFNIVDYAGLQIGAVVVALFPNYSSELIVDLTKHCDAKVAFVEGRYLNLVDEVIKDKTSKLEHAFCLEDNKNQMSLTNLIDAETLTETSVQRLSQMRDDIKPKDSAIIFYTSGTSDRPNGAVVSHESYSLTINNCFDLFGLGPGEKVLSYLPPCHAYERAHHYFYLASGLHIHYAESPQDMVSNAQEVKPAMFTTVPMFLEKVLEVVRINSRRVNSEAQAGYLKAINLAQDQDPKSLAERKKKTDWELLETDYFSRWRSLLGGELKLVSCAGAPLPKHVGQFFYTIGIPVMCCYGLTEIAGVTYHRITEIPNYEETGTFLDGIEVKLADNGELLLRTDQCMIEYYKNPELTHKVIDAEGWLHTGDACEITEDHGLKVKGRLRHMFKLPSGEYVSPGHIETILVKSQYITNAFVYNNSGSLCALVVPESSLVDKDETEDIKTLIDQDVQSLYNKSVHPMQQIKSIDLVVDNWGPSTGELTPTMKLKRHIIRDKYKSLIEA